MRVTLPCPPFFFSFFFFFFFYLFLFLFLFFFLFFFFLLLLSHSTFPFTSSFKHSTSILPFFPFSSFSSSSTSYTSSFSSASSSFCIQPLTPPFQYSVFPLTFYLRERQCKRWCLRLPCSLCYWVYFFSVVHRSYCRGFVYRSSPVHPENQRVPSLVSAAPCSCSLSLSGTASFRLPLVRSDVNNQP